MKLYRFVVLFVISVLFGEVSAQDGDIPPEVRALLPPGYVISKPSTVVFGKKKLLDSSVREFIYYHAMYDPESDLMLDEQKILQVGDKVSFYCDYGIYRWDSIAYKATMDCVSVNTDHLERLVKGQSMDEHIVIRNHEKGDTLEVYDNVGMDKFRYREEQPDFNWVISDETKKIGPYECKKAEATFRGRNWTAWYTEEIPVSEGPWKFAGLPGLILMVQDSKAEHTIKLLKVRDSVSPIVLRDMLVSKADRKKLLEKKLSYLKNPFLTYKGMDIMPRDENGSVVKPSDDIKRFSNLIEKE